MTEKMIRDAYCKIRTIDQTIPDDVLDFMKDAAIEKMNGVNKNSFLADVGGSLTPFGESIKLLRDLADLQNGAPLERYRQEWEETMKQVYDFLNRWEGQ